MKKLLKTFERFDIVVVPYPFSDRDVRKRRPAVLLSPMEFHGMTGQAVMAMITTARRSVWPHDISIKDIGSAGLPKPSFVRMRLSTIDLQLVVRTTGRLAPEDRVSLQRAMAELFDI